jgi:signal peptidase II
LLLAGLALAADQIAKRWAVTDLRRAGGHVAWPGPVDLTLSLNQSNAFGLTPVIGQATRWILMGANLVVAAVILFVLITGRFGALVRYGLALIMAGATGNALDRVFDGAVVDFLDASKIGFVWIFNLADASIDLGIGLILLSFLMQRRDAAPGAKAESP